MKLITWIIALYNRKWQGKLDALMLATELDIEPNENPKSVDDNVDFLTEVMDNQPTHLSHKLLPRGKRNNRRGVKQYGRT